MPQCRTLTTPVAKEQSWLMTIYAITAPQNSARPKTLSSASTNISERQHSQLGNCRLNGALFVADQAASNIISICFADC